MRIGISVYHQDSCIFAGQIMLSIGDDNNKVYVKIIDDFYVILHVRRRRCVT